MGDYRENLAWRLIDDFGLDKDESLTLLRIAKWEECYEAHKTIATATPMTAARISKAEGRLVKKGLIKRSHKIGRVWKRSMHSCQCGKNVHFLSCPYGKLLLSMRQGILANAARHTGSYSQRDTEKSPDDPSPPTRDDDGGGGGLGFSSPGTERGAGDDDDDEIEGSERRETTTTTRTIDVKPDPKAAYEDAYNEDPAAAAVDDTVRTEDPDPIPLTGPKVKASDNPLDKLTAQQRTERMQAMNEERDRLRSEGKR